MLWADFVMDLSDKQHDDIRQMTWTRQKENKNLIKRLSSISWFYFRF